MDMLKKSSKTHKNRTDTVMVSSPNLKFLWFISSLLVVFAVVFTILVGVVDVGPIGPEGASVGFSAINQEIANATGFNETWYQITNFFSFVLVAIVAVYAGIGLSQLIKRKSLKKVDRELIALGLFYLAVIAVYVLFEKLLVLNYRPVLLGDAPEPSYPSSHTLFAVCLCGSAMMINQKLFVGQRFTKYLNIALAIIAVVVVVGRLLSGVHWFSDIAGGVIISSALLAVFAALLFGLPQLNTKTSVETPMPSKSKLRQ